MRNARTWLSLATALTGVALVLQVAPGTAHAGVIEDLTWEDPAERTLPGAPPPGWNAQVCCSRSAQVVNTPTRSGGYAVRFQLDRTDPDVAASKRAELVERTLEPATAERWYGFSIYLPSTNWTTPDPSAEIVAQWHHAGNTGSPPLALVTRNGTWEISQHWENTERPHPVGAYRIGHWTDWVFHVKWSPTTGGLVEAWQNGNLVFRQTGKNKYDDGQGVYMKFGIYKWDWKSNPTRSNTDRRILFHDELRIADQTGSYNLVAPR